MFKIKKMIFVEGHYIKNGYIYRLKKHQGNPLDFGMW